jgi:uncharacterized membrane protein YfcA
MSFLIVSAAALGVALLTLFSGFGLGTLLLPIFALFFPIQVAIAATAVVHLANNLFKVALLGRKADVSVLLRFAPPAAAAAFLGALALRAVATLPPLAVYRLGGRVCEIAPLNLLVAALMLLFAAFELHPRFERFAFSPRHFFLGGLLSGFFGGLSGHQGALRSAFLLKSGLSPERFVATSAVCAVVIDVSRLLVYGPAFFAKDFGALGGESGRALVAVAAASAFVGTFAGTRLIGKMSLRGMQVLAGVLLVGIALALGAGII